MPYGAWTPGPDVLVEWRDRGIVLAAHAHGEGKAVVRLLTRDHGLHAGVVRPSRRQRGALEPGTEVAAVWRARLDGHLGTFTLEPERSHAGAVMADPGRLLGLAASCAVATAALPERQPHPALFTALATLLGVLGHDDWGALVVRWEVGLLAELGYGLDLSRCAATGGRDDLVYVSPRSGRAVSEAAGRPYHDRLLPLPAFLLGQGAAEPRAIADGLRLTGHFLHYHVFAGRHTTTPPVRLRLEDWWRGRACSPPTDGP